MTDRTTTRRLARATLLATVLAMATLSSAPAWAAPPDTWAETDNPSTVQALIEIAGPVLLIIAVIALLTYLPSMIHRAKGEDALTFSDTSDWFGGPRTGIDEKALEAHGTGGASARW